MNKDTIDKMADGLKAAGEALKEHIKSGNPDVVMQVAGLAGGNKFVFATKYCSFVMPEAFPIYDSMVIKTLNKFQEMDCFYSCSNFKDLRFESLKDKGNYAEFRSIIRCFLCHYKLSASYKELDKFLWLVGKNA